jgi:DNA-binding Lrp family transcriptional regulator
MITLTAKDEELIALLQANARAPVSALARKLGRSRTTVQDRLRRLEQQGIITGYHLQLAENSSRSGIRAFVTIEVEPRQAGDVARALQKLPQVEALHSVSGKYDLIGLVRTSSAQDMDRVLDAVGAIPGVTGTESAVILSTKLDRP